MGRVTGWERRVARPATVAGAATALLLLGALGPVEAADRIPIADVFEITIPVDDGRGVAHYEGAIHGAYRTDDATVLYWSLRAAKDSGADLRTVFEHEDVDLVGGVLADPRSLDVLLPLRDDAGCLCTEADDLDPSQDPYTFQVMYTAFPRIPADTTAIDVDVDGRGTIVAGVPVSNILPAGQQRDRASVVLGRGWPAVPSEERVEQVAVRDPLDLVGRAGAGDGSVTTEGTGADRLVRFDADVLFAFDRSDLSAQAQQVLESAIAEIEAAGELGRIEVVGHTDGQGTAEHNQTLSVARARTVADAMRAALGEDLHVDVEGRGWDEPIATNDTEEGRAKNRRVTISYETAGGDR
ncbi:OmpA family protein [Ornithinimicrobium humiphilum]|uniref:OmpA family protein n=1 Tax=Ornithinimicrobium humiphilum TaxID=125288 RepID=A0A543KL94_9MICO|nr:OmpA family protein [Ornithinimicrobium humiphilum]